MSFNIIVKLTILLLICCQITTSSQRLNRYCNADLCKGKAHVACGNDMEIHSSCASYSEYLELSPKLKTKIVKKHNEYRNMLALGKVPDFQPATRMATMKWSDELAFLAELNVKSCSGTHDACRNTNKFKHSGQNIARRTTKEDTISKKQLEFNVLNGIDRWFDEHSVCPRDGTTVYNNGKKPCGHFTVMIADKNTHVGCAVIHMKSRKTVLTCNYAYTNMKNEKLYTPGKAASKCKTGKNAKYPGLCSKNEKY